MESDHYRFQLGSTECVSLYDGSHDYKLEDMVTNAPRPAVALALQALGLSPHVVTTPFTCLYLNTDQHRVLVDTGTGELLATAGKLPHSLHHAGVTPDSIDSIFITHAHPDHVGGVLDARGEPIFTHATYFICRTEWEFRFSEQAVTQAGAWMTNIARQRLTPLQGKTVFLESEAEILPGVSVLLAPGHTPGHMVVSFSAQGERLLYVGDTVLHPLHLGHPAWLPVYDLLPEAAAASKQRIFDLAASTGCWVMGQQFPPFPSLGHVIKQQLGWGWQPIESGRPITR